MPDPGKLTPRDLIDPVVDILDRQAGQWASPGQLWAEIRRIRPDLAEAVEYRVNRYKDPVRNNAVWFVSNTLYHVAKLSGYTLSDNLKVPEMKDLSFWLVIRKEVARV